MGDPTRILDDEAEADVALKKAAEKLKRRQKRADKPSRSALPVELVTRLADRVKLALDGHGGEDIIIARHAHEAGVEAVTLAAAVRREIKRRKRDAGETGTLVGKDLGASAARRVAKEALLVRVEARMTADGVKMAEALRRELGDSRDDFDRRYHDLAKLLKRRQEDGIHLKVVENAVVFGHEKARIPAARKDYRAFRDGLAAARKAGTVAEPLPPLDLWLARQGEAGQALLEPLVRACQLLGKADPTEEAKRTLNWLLGYR